ncbi:MAG: putative metallopeptidase [Thermodesulfobacteriota bacterium]
MIQYGLAEDIDLRVKEIIRKLRMNHIDGARVICLRSKGSGSRRVIARCHGLSRIMQVALCQKPHYIIEVLSERFDRLSHEDQTRVLIHEILHIPHAFGGGFRAHKSYVTRAKVEKIYDEFKKIERKEKEEFPK